MKPLKNEGDALCYMTECTLATIADMAMKKSPPAREYARQISIAQKGIDAIALFGIHINSREFARVSKISSIDYTVEDWAKEIEKTFAQ